MPKLEIDEETFRESLHRLYEAFLPYHRDETLWEDECAVVALVDALGDFFDAWSTPVTGAFPAFDEWFEAVLEEQEE